MDASRVVLTARWRADFQARRLHLKPDDLAEQSHEMVSVVMHVAASSRLSLYRGRQCGWHRECSVRLRVLHGVAARSQTGSDMTEHEVNVGARVHSRDGEDIGEIAQVLYHPETGVLLGTGWFGTPRVVDAGLIVR